MKLIGFLMFVVISGCASNSQVDVLRSQVQSNRFAISELQKQNREQDNTIINLYSRIAGSEARISSLTEQLNETSTSVDNLSGKFDSKFKQNIMK